MFQIMTYTEYMGTLKGLQSIYDEIRDDSLEFSPLSIIRECIKDLQTNFRDNPDSKLTPHITDIEKLNLLLIQQIHADEYISMCDFFNIIQSLGILCMMICKEFQTNNVLDENHEYIDTQNNFDIAETIIENILY